MIISLPDVPAVSERAIRIAAAAAGVALAAAVSVAAAVAGASGDRSSVAPPAVASTSIPPWCDAPHPDSCGRLDPPLDP